MSRKPFPYRFVDGTAMQRLQRHLGNYAIRLHRTRSGGCTIYVGSVEPPFTGETVTYEFDELSEGCRFAGQLLRERVDAHNRHPEAFLIDQSIAELCAGGPKTVQRSERATPPVAAPPIEAALQHIAEALRLLKNLK